VLFEYLLGFGGGATRCDQISLQGFRLHGNFGNYEKRWKVTVIKKNYSFRNRSSSFFDCQPKLSGNKWKLNGSRTLFRAIVSRFIQRVSSASAGCHIFSSLCAATYTRLTRQFLPQRQQIDKLKSFYLPDSSLSDCLLFPPLKLQLKESTTSPKLKVIDRSESITREELSTTTQRLELSAQQRVVFISNLKRFWYSGELLTLRELLSKTCGSHCVSRREMRLKISEMQGASALRTSIYFNMLFSRVVALGRISKSILM